MRISNAAGASAGQGRLPWRQAAALDACQSCCTCGGQARLVAVTGLHFIRIGLPARIRTSGRPLGRKERREQNQYRWDKEHHKPLF